MKRTHTRTIRVPQLLTDGSDASEERNALVYNWVKRTALPTLDDYIVTPFETVIKEAVFAEACAAENISDGQFLADRHTKTWNFGDIQLQAQAYRQQSIAHGEVVAHVHAFLEDCLKDNNGGVHREFIRKTREEGPHVSAAYILTEIDRLRVEQSRGFVKQAVQKDGQLSAEGLNGGVIISRV